MMDKMKLSNGYELPCLCMGTDIVSAEFFDESTYKQVLKRAKMEVRNVIKKLLGKDTKKYYRSKGIIRCFNNAYSNGCFFYDTSRAYGGAEKMLSFALANIDRSHYYICTKIDTQSQLNDIPAKDVLLKSLEQLNTDYVDVLLLHWPVTGKYLDYWRQLEELYLEGKCKAIGVSNCKIHHLEEIKKIAKVIPMVNEVELHPLLTEMELREYCKRNDIQIMAYTSTARNDFRLCYSGRMERVCQKYGKSLSQIILKWHIQNGIIPIFNTSSLKHFRDNMDIFDFDIDEDDMKTIDGMNINARTRYDSDNCEWDRL